MRLFIAAELPGELTEALAESSALLRDCVRGRYVAPDSYHITLAFLGSVEARLVDDAIDSLEAACKNVEPFRIALGELGSFGRRSKASLWQGIRNAEPLEELASSVRFQLRNRDLPFDSKPFRAHVTLMRSADLAHGTLPAPVLATGSIQDITLFQSDLSGDRPQYEPLHTMHLQ